MQKLCVQKLMTVVTLLISASVMDAAPLHVLGLQWDSLRGNQKPPEAWTRGPCIHDIITTSTVKLLMTGPMTTYSDGHKNTVPVRVSDILDKSFTLKAASVKTDSQGPQKTVSATNDFDNHLITESVTDGLDMTEVAVKEGNSIYKRQKLNPVKSNLNKPPKAVLSNTSAKIISSDISTLDRHQKFMRMLSAIEELHRSLDSQITIRSRGNTNSRSLKRNKMTVAESNMKSTTASSVISSGTSPRLSTELVDPKHLAGKAFKKTLPSTPKKTNKRVCFWKYCSQN